jgi:uncharacterized protein (DUF885 family)
MTTTTERSQAEVAALAVGYWDDVLRLNPLLATQVGDDRFDDRLPEIGCAAREDALPASASALRQARSIDRNGLSMVERTTLDVIEAHARAEFERLSLGHDLLEAVDHLYGPGTLLDRILEVQPLQTSGQVRRFRLRLAALPAYLDGATELMREGIARGDRASVHRTRRGGRTDAPPGRPPARCGDHRLAGCRQRPARGP